MTNNIDNTATHITAADAGTRIEEGTDYEVLHTDEEGTSQVGIVSGFTALRMLLNSTDPNSLTFIPLP